MTPLYASVCPSCGGGLRLRHRRRDGNPFVGCSGYPGCEFACDLLPPPGNLAEEVGDALKHLIAKWHPDRCRKLTPHEVVSELNCLRDWLTVASEHRRSA